jgi:P4 family phage/plasmid primase-like protien
MKAPPQRPAPAGGSKVIPIITGQNPTPKPNGAEPTTGIRPVAAVEPSKPSKTPTPPPAQPPIALPAATRAKRPFLFTRGSHVELAHALLFQLETFVDGRNKLPIYDEGSLYSYDGAHGVWARVDEVKAGRLVQSFDGATVGKVRLKLKESDIKGAMACARREVAHDGFFSATAPGLVFRDTLVTVRPDGTIQKKPHSSEHRARFAYDFDYTDEDPVRFLKSLGGIFAPDEDKAEKIQFIGEFGGASLLGGATRLQRWVLLRGLGDDGKSTLIDMIRAAMPIGSTCSIRPQDLEDEYSRADLAGKLLNTVTEVKQRDVLEAETLKAVTVGDEMRGRRIRESPIDFKPRAGHIFAANGYPKFSDSSHGFWRRPVVVTFNRRFTGDPERVVGLAEDIIAAERAQVVCWLVRMGAKALARGGYVEPKSHAAALKEWRGETDAVFEFVLEALQPSPSKTPTKLNGWAEGTVLYKAFIAWSEATGHRSMSSTAFGRRLTELGFPHQNGGDGDRLRPLRPLRSGETRHELTIKKGGKE